MLRFPSGFVDVNILFISMFKKDNTDIFIDYGSEKLKNIFHLNSIEWWTEIYADWLPYFWGEWLYHTHDTDNVHNIYT